MCPRDGVKPARQAVLAVLLGWRVDFLRGLVFFFFFPQSKIAVGGHTPSYKLHLEWNLFSLGLPNCSSKCLVFVWELSCFPSFVFTFVPHKKVAECVVCVLAFKNFYLSIVDFHGCVNFRCTAKWISYTYTYSFTFLDSFEFFFRVWGFYF